MRRVSLGSNAERSPITLKRTPFSCSLPTSCSSAPTKSCMRKDTSSGGRRQFSLEKANSVRYSTPRSPHARTVARTDSAPRLCPATRGRKRCFAQRPLPSMMMAMCRGTRRASGIWTVELENEDTNLFCLLDALDRHQIGFFLLQQLIDIRDVPIGEFLDVILRPALLVFRHFLLLQQFFQVVDGVTSHVAHGDARGLALVAHHLREVLAPFFGQRGHRHTYGFARCGGIEPQVGIPDGFLDRARHLLLPWRHPYGTRVDQRYVRHLRQGSRRSVVVHHDMIEQAGVSAAGADLGKIGLERL